MNKENLVEVGKVIKAFGLRGELKVHPEVFFEDFLRFKAFLVISPKGGKKILNVEHVRTGAGNSLIVKFKEIDSREIAEKLKGLPLLVNSEDLPGLQTDEYYIRDLIGCLVFDGTVQVGEVVDFINQGIYGSLVVLTTENKEVLVPFVKNYVKSVDTLKKEITVNEFQSLKEINP